MLHLLGRELHWSPGAASQFRNALPDRQVQPIHERRVDPPTQPGSFQSFPLMLFLSTQHPPLNFHRPVPAAMFNDMCGLQRRSNCSRARVVNSGKTRKRSTGAGKPWAGGSRSAGTASGCRARNTMNGTRRRYVPEPRSPSGAESHSAPPIL